MSHYGHACCGGVDGSANLHLQGQLKVGDTVELPALKLQRKVKTHPAPCSARCLDTSASSCGASCKHHVHKRHRAGMQVRSLQMFGTPVQAAAAGDRVAMAVTQLDSSQVWLRTACNQPPEVDVHASRLPAHHMPSSQRDAYSQTQTLLHAAAAMQAPGTDQYTSRQLTWLSAPAGGAGPGLRTRQRAHFRRRGRRRGEDPLLCRSASLQVGSRTHL